MNVKKTALATAIALTMGGGSAWADTSTVKGQFILDKTEVKGGETVNLALLGLTKDGEVDRFGESEGSTIMAVVNTIKGKIQGGETNPSNAGDGYFASDVKYVRLEQGVGRVSIYYPNDIVGSEKTTDTVTVYLQERTGGNYKPIGQAVDKTITIKAGISVPAALTFSSFEPAPADPIVKDKIDRGADGLKAKMTAGFEGAQLRVRGLDQSVLRAANIIKLEVIDNERPDEEKVIYSDTQRMIRDEALFTLTSEITEAGTYDMVASLEGETGVNSLTMVSRDTLMVLPTMTPAGLMISADKARITKPAADACQLTFPHNQVCQGAKITLNLLDEYGNDMEQLDELGNPTTSTDLLNDLIVSFADANKVVSDTALKFKIPAGSSEGMPTDGTDEYLGNQAFETIKTGTTSLVAKVDTGGSGINTSNAVAIKVVGKSLVAEKADEFNSAQKAGTEFKAFKVRVSNNAGGIENGTNPGAIVIESWDKEQVTVNRNPETFIVEGYFEKVTGSKYLISDQAGNYGQVWVMGEPIAPAAANKVTLLNPTGEEITSINPAFDKEHKQYVTSIPEAAFRMVDAYGNAITENVGDFQVSSSVAKEKATITYVNTAGGSHGEPGRDQGGVVNVIYDTVGSKAFAGEDTITIAFNKPALSNKTFTITTTVPAAVEEGLDRITSYIDTNDLPVNSEVALKVETLDKQDNLFMHDNLVVTVTFNEGIEETDGSEEGGEVAEVITPAVYELIGNPLTEAQCPNAAENFVDGKCNITPEICIARGYIFTEAQGCLEQEEKIVASGGRLTFKTGRKLFVVEAGSRAGKFSLTFKDANNPDVKDTRLFNVTKEIVTPVEDTEEGCIGDGNFWMADDKACKTMPPIGNPIPGKTTSGLVKRDGTITFTSKAQFNGGVAVGTDEFSSDASMELTASGKNVLFAGNIQFDSGHAGETVDIVIAVSYKVGAFGETRWFTFDPEIGLVPWNGRPAELVTFMEHEVVKDENLQVTIFDGTLDESNVLPGTLDVYLAYRRDNGEVHFNGLPITLRMQ